MGGGMTLAPIPVSQHQAIFSPTTPTPLPGGALFPKHPNPPGILRSTHTPWHHSAQGFLFLGPRWEIPTQDKAEKETLS